MHAIRRRCIEIVTSAATALVVVVACVLLPLPRAVPEPVAPANGIDGSTLYSLDFAIAGPRRIRLRWHPQPPVVVRSGEALTFTGWAIDARSGSPSSGAIAVVDGGASFRGAVETLRPDVARYLHNPDATKSGFTIIVPPGSLSPGEHRFAFRFLTANGTDYFRSRDDVDVLSTRD